MFAGPAVPSQAGKIAAQGVKDIYEWICGGQQQIQLRFTFSEIIQKEWKLYRSALRISVCFASCVFLNDHSKW